MFADQAGQTNPEQTTLALQPWGALESALWDYLKEHARGRGCAVSRKEIASALGLDVREVSAKIKDLIEVHGRLIGTDRTGVWIPETDEEAAAAAENIRHRFLSLARRYCAIKNMREDEFSAQIPLWLKEQEGHRE